jgi:16S rRNA processing protein RimM
VSDEFITVARVKKTQGRHGEVAAEIYTDFPEKFSERKRLFAVKDDARRELAVEDAWPHKNFIVLKFAGVDTITDAESLIGYELQIPASERSQLEAGTFYVSDLVGCTVVDLASSREIGEVAEVQFGSGEAPNLLVKDGEREHLVPFAESYIVKVDIAGKRLEMRLPDGLIEP